MSTTEYSNAKLKLNRFCTENQRRCNTCMQKRTHFPTAPRTEKGSPRHDRHCEKDVKTNGWKVDPPFEGQATNMPGMNWPAQDSWSKKLSSKDTPSLPISPRTLQTSTCMLEVEGFSEPWLNAAETQEPLFARWPGDLHRWHLSCLSWLSAQEQWECESGSGYAAPHLVATTPTSSFLACASQGAPRRQVRC